MGIAAASIANVLVLALDGESISENGGNGTVLAVASVLSLVVGYLVLFALWRYVFSAKARAKRKEPPD
jgi:hypothetical protein